MTLGTAPADVARLVDQVARLLRWSFDERAREIGVTRVQWQVLMALSRNEGIGQAQLGELLQVQPMSVSKLVGRLVTAGLIVRREHPADRRARRLYLTAKADPILESLAPVARQSLDEALRGLGPSEIALLSNKLQILRSNLHAERCRSR